MAFGAGGTDTGGIGIVIGSFVFLVHIPFHFMTGDAKRFRIGHLHTPVKTTPENNSGHKNPQH
jgi:hypothetical protein